MRKRGVGRDIDGAAFAPSLKRHGMPVEVESDHGNAKRGRPKQAVDDSDFFFGSRPDKGLLLVSEQCSRSPTRDFDFGELVLPGWIEVRALPSRRQALQPAPHPAFE